MNMKPTIYAYQKAIVGDTVVEMNLPDSQGQFGTIHCDELATIEGTTYVSVPDDVSLPEQPPGLQIEAVEMTPTLVAQIKAASPLVALMEERCEAATRARYAAEDEAQFAQVTDPTELDAPARKALDEYLAFIETVAASKQCQLAWWGLE